MGSRGSWGNSTGAVLAAALLAGVLLLPACGDSSPEFGPAAEPAESPPVQVKTAGTAVNIGEGAEAKTIQDMNSESLKQMDIILNATSMGMESQINETPLPKEFIQPHHIVFDAVYVPSETRLLREAQEQGATIIRGSEMLLYQGVAQFELYTGEKAPVEVMRNVLTKHNSL